MTELVFIDDNYNQIKSFPEKIIVLKIKIVDCSNLVNVGDFIKLNDKEYIACSKTIEFNDDKDDVYYRNIKATVYVNLKRTNNGKLLTQDEYLKECYDEHVKHIKECYKDKFVPTYEQWYYNFI